MSNDWRSHVDDKGRTYYYHKYTRETQWEPPVGFCEPPPIHSSSSPSARRECSPLPRNERRSRSLSPSKRQQRDSRERGYISRDFREHSRRRRAERRQNEAKEIMPTRRRLEVKTRSNPLCLFIFKIRRIGLV